MSKIKVAVGIFAFFMMLTNPQMVYEAAVFAVDTWWKSVIPALLPFFIVSEFLMAVGLMECLAVWTEPIMRPFNRHGLCFGNANRRQHNGRLIQKKSLHQRRGGKAFGIHKQFGTSVHSGCGCCRYFPNAVRRHNFVFEPLPCQFFARYYTALFCQRQKQKNCILPQKSAESGLQPNPLLPKSAFGQAPQYCGQKILNQYRLGGRLYGCFRHTYRRL